MRGIKGSKAQKSVEIASELTVQGDRERDKLE